MTERLELEYLVDADELRRLQQFMEPYRRRRLNAMIIPASLVGLVTVFITARLQGVDVRVAGAMTVFAAAGVGSIQYVYWRTGALDVLRGAFQELGAAFKTKPTRYRVRVDDDGLTFRTGLRSKEMFWHNISEWREDDDAWLFRDDRDGLLVPEAAFDSKREFAAFTDLVHERLAEEHG